MARQFDINNAMSCEVPLAFEIADKLSELPAFIKLSEASSAADARKKIIIGIASDSNDSRQFGLDELEHEFFCAQLQPPEEDDHVVADGDTNDISLESGVLRLRFRRQVRKSEQIEQEYLFFWDLVSAISKQWHAATRGVSGPRLPLLTRTQSPLRSSVQEEKAQGAHLTAEFSIEWGDQLQ